MKYLCVKCEVWREEADKPTIFASTLRATWKYPNLPGQPGSTPDVITIHESMSLTVGQYYSLSLLPVK